MIDNYDSFTYNLVQYLGELGADVEVRRNDAITLDEIAALTARRHRRLARARARRRRRVSRCRRSSASRARSRSSASASATRRSAPRSAARSCARPASCTARRRRSCTTAAACSATSPNPFDATRYHSLVIERASLPAELEVTAWTAEGEIMGVRHRSVRARGRAVPSGVDPDARRASSCSRNFLDGLPAR